MTEDQTPNPTEDPNAAPDAAPSSTEPATVAAEPRPSAGQLVAELRTSIERAQAQGLTMPEHVWRQRVLEALDAMAFELDFGQVPR